MCTAKSSMGGKKKWNGNACNNLKSIYNSYKLNHNKYNQDVTEAKTLRKLNTIYNDLNIPFPLDNTILKKYKDTLSTVIHIKSKGLYYIHIGGTYTFIKIPPVTKAYLNTGKDVLNKAGAQRSAVYKVGKEAVRMAGAVGKP
jgi:hypothetical protein